MLLSYISDALCDKLEQLQRDLHTTDNELFRSLSTLYNMGRGISKLGEEETHLLYLIAGITEDKRQPCTSPTELFNMVQAWPPDRIKQKFTTRTLSQGIHS